MKLIHWFLARFHLSNHWVCELSRDLGPIDYHDYTDDVYGTPTHMVLLVCKRCNKRFTM